MLVCMGLEPRASISSSLVESRQNRPKKSTLLVIKLASLPSDTREIEWQGSISPTFRPRRTYYNSIANSQPITPTPITPEDWMAGKHYLGDLDPGWRAGDPGAPLPSDPEQRLTITTPTPSLELYLTWRLDGRGAASRWPWPPSWWPQASPWWRSPGRKWPPTSGSWGPTPLGRLRGQSYCE